GDTPAIIAEPEHEERKMTAVAADLTTLSPPEIDELWAEAIAPASQALGAANELARSARRYVRAGGAFAQRGEQRLAEAQAAQEAALVAYREASAPFDAEFERRGGWTRYLQVIASNGHVHHGHCHTILPGRTMVAPVFELSGQGGAGVVAAAGFSACSKCFPDAPVETVEDKRAANVAKGRCAGTGTQASSLNSSRRYGRCGECGGTFGVSTYGILRPHKAAA
ncbi:MAG: hypothetical protein ACRDMZ_18705, partial [Solirubrobacteraceae bacterium]